MVNGKSLLGKARLVSRLFIRALIVPAAFGVGSGGALAQADPEFYKDKTITMVIGNGPGTAYDSYARHLGRHLGRHIPGNPVILAKNMPGAGSLLAANHLFNVAPRDGMTIGGLATTAVLQPLFGLAEARFKPTEFVWIGNLDMSIGTCAIWHTAPIKTFEDLFTRETLFGGSGSAAVNSLHAAALKNLLGLKLRVIQGFRGSVDVKLAMERGEVQGNCGMPLATLKAQHIDDLRSGRLKPIVQLAFDKHPELKGVAHIYDYAKTQEMRQVFDLIFGVQEIGRPFAAPPGIPEAAKAALRTAFDATMKDPEFNHEATKMNLAIAPLSGQEVQQLFVKFMGYSLEVVKRTTAAYAQ